MLPKSSQNCKSLNKRKVLRPGPFGHQFPVFVSCSILTNTLLPKPLSSVFSHLASHLVSHLVSCLVFCRWNSVCWVIFTSRWDLFMPKQLHRSWSSEAAPLQLLALLRAHLGSSVTGELYLQGLQHSTLVVMKPLRCAAHNVLRHTAPSVLWCCTLVFYVIYWDTMHRLYFVAVFWVHTPFPSLPLKFRSELNTVAGVCVDCALSMVQGAVTKYWLYKCSPLPNSKTGQMRLWLHLTVYVFLLMTSTLNGWTAYSTWSRPM